MKKYVFILFLTVFSITVSAQKDKEKGGQKGEEQKEEPIDYSENVATVNNVIKTFYKEISGEKDKKRNWKLFKFLFHPDAKLITAGKDDERQFQVKWMGTGDYVKASEKWMVSNGFFEKEIHRKSDIFGKMAHVFSTFEAYHTKADEEPIMRGIYSFQLLNDGERWWILNLYWTNETWLHPIPEKYLD